MLDYEWSLNGGLNECLLYEGVAPTFSPVSTEFVLRIDSMSAILGFATSGIIECPTSDFFRARDILELMIMSDE